MLPIKNIKINLPLSFCGFARKNNFFSPFRLYVYLKTISKGQIFLSPSLKKKIAKDLGVGPKTIDNLLHKLQGRNWIGHNPVSGYFFIRGFHKVQEIEGLIGRRGVWIDVSKDIQSQERFKALVVGAIIGQMANVSKYRMRKERENESQNTLRGVLNTTHNNPVPSHFPIACRALSKMLSISTSTASNYKKLADHHKFIHITKQMKRLPLTGRAKDRDAGFAANFKFSHPEIAHKVRIKGGKVFLQEVDLILPCLNYTKRWRTSTRTG